VNEPGLRPESGEGRENQRPSSALELETQTCPSCGHIMPALKGAKASVCATCGYKESCCY